MFLVLIAILTFGCSHSERTTKTASKPITQDRSTTPLAKQTAKPLSGPATSQKAEPVEKETPPVTPSESDKSDDPLADLESEDSESYPQVGARHRSKSGQIPARGCVEINDQPTRVWPSAGPSSIVAVDDDFVVSGYVKGQKDERVFVVRLSLGSLPVPLVTERVEAQSRERFAPPGLGIGARRNLMLAITDGQGAVFIRSISITSPAGGGSVKRIIEKGADTRFAPAISNIEDQTLVAWTTGTTPMEARLAVLDAAGKLKAVHVIKPPAMGAAAPVFIQGLYPPVLLVVDARDGFSPLVRVPVSSDGTPGRSKVAVPIGMVATPVELAAAHSQVGTYVGYTAVGKAATSAIGLIRIEPESGSPIALVPGTGYGKLRVAAVAAPKALIFAADAPVEKGKADQREILVRLVDAQGIGPRTVINGPDGTAFQVKIARNQSGVVAAVYSSRSGVFVSWLRCDDS